MGYTITPTELKSKLDRGDQLVLLDVREQWRLAGSVPLVPRHRTVYLCRPGVNAAHQVLYIREPLLEKKGGGVGASHAVVADGDDLCIAIEFS